MSLISTQIIDVISTVGFPIATFFAMGWYVIQRDKREDIRTKENNCVISKNTEAIEKLKTIIEIKL